MHTQREMADVEVEDAHHWRRRMDCEVQWMRMEQDSSPKNNNKTIIIVIRINQ